MSDKPQKHTAYPTSFGTGRFQDKRKGELCRLLECANAYLTECHRFTEEVWQPEPARQMEERLYRIQEQIAELKRLVKQ